MRLSQGSMMNVLTMKLDGKRNCQEAGGVSDVGPKKKLKRTFKDVTSEDKINAFSNKKFAVESKKKIKWAVNMYCEWRRNRMLDPFVPNQIKSANLDLLFTFSEGDLCYALCRFIREVKKIDGSEFPPNTLREIIIMLQMHMQQNGLNWKLLDGNAFYQLRNVLDNTMKERHAMGLGVRKSSRLYH